MAFSVTLPSPCPLASNESSNSTAAAAAASHVVLFPFMSRGHTIPLINLANLFLSRNVLVTIFTTPANSPFISSSLAHTTARVLELPFPQTIPNIPPGVESTDTLPSMSLFLAFVEATKLLQPHFDLALKTLLPPVSCIIYDGFLPWARLSAAKVDAPTLVSFGMNTLSMTIARLVVHHQPHKEIESDEELFSVPFLPSMKLCKREIGEPFIDPELKGPLFQFITESWMTMAQSGGIVVNSFYELEHAYVDIFNREFNCRAWIVGPLCMASPLKLQFQEKARWLQWLDDKEAIKRHVLYVAFGTQAEISAGQLLEIASGLERSEVDFLWVVRGKEEDLGGGFEKRVADRGLLVREWVEQREILEHEIVKGFLSHCGWNSVLESVCAKVPILAWPMTGEQHLNAKMIVEEMQCGLRLKEGGEVGLVGWERVRDRVRELMLGEKGEESGKKVGELGEKAKAAVEEGGSSWQTFELMLDEIVRKS